MKGNVKIVEQSCFEISRLDMNKGLDIILDVRIAFAIEDMKDSMAVFLVIASQLTCVLDHTEASSMAYKVFANDIKLHKRKIFLLFLMSPHVKLAAVEILLEFTAGQILELLETLI